MEKHFIDIFVPHRKLRKGYYLIGGLLLVLWLPDLNKLNIPLPSKVFETWFLDKLLLTIIVLLGLYAFSTYYLSCAPKENKPKINFNDYDFIEGAYVHKATGKQYYQRCLLKGVEAELTEYSLGPVCQNCNGAVGMIKPA